ncbi:MAG TPA: hypothetical protein VJ623_05445 [Holophagaceae bacterium]|nr:hypothetical protein [Holophagaceae bacterium]
MNSFGLPLRFNLNLTPIFGQIEAYAYTRAEDGRVHLGRLLEMTPLDPSVGTHEPTFHMDRSSAQELMDELWRIGMRPSEGTGSAGAMAATQAHLRDLQRLVFEKRGVE